ncbi:MAG: InlB B-repeat-containing protein [Clostridiales bacterium]|nr:InlB B-repeat-containing protein [Clostridiales bacterium]
MKKNKTLRKVLMATLLPIGAVVIGATAIVGAILGTNGGKKLPLSTAESTTSVSSTTINLDVNKTASTYSIDKNSRTGVQELINYVAGASANINYNTLSTDMESWKGSGNLSSTTTKTKTADKFTAKTVTLGGIVWNVMYVSKADYTANGTTAGDIIVTLWQANSDANYMSAYNPWYADTPNARYPSAMYGSSLVRSTLNGTSYVASNGATTLTAGTQNSHWAPFTRNSVHSATGTVTTSGFSEVLATPANMLWQKTQRSNDGSNGSYPWYFPNDAWDASTLPASNWGTNGWYQKTLNSATVNYNYSDNGDATTYAAWKNDYLWLPSMVETGWNDSNYSNKNGTAGSGIWNASASQRATNVSSGNAQYAWLRSGRDLDASYAYRLSSSGGYAGSPSTSTSYAVRPALHLNLKSAAQAAGLFEQKITYHTAYGSAPTTLDKYAPGATTELPEPTDWASASGAANLEFVGWSKGGYGKTPVITSVEDEDDELDLYAAFKPKAASAASSLAENSLNLNVTCGVANATLSATVSHALSGDGVTVSTYWKKEGSDTKLGERSGSAAELVIDEPAIADTGKYTLYYTLTPNGTLAGKGVIALSDVKALDFDLKVFGAASTVETNPTFKDKIYVGQAISPGQLTGGVVKSGGNTIAGTWAILTEGVYKKGATVEAEFTPTDENIAPVKATLDPKAEQLTITLNEVVPEATTAAGPIGSGVTIDVDYGTGIAFQFINNDNSAVIEFYVRQDGVWHGGPEADDVPPVQYRLASPAGYIPFVYSTDDSSKEHINLAVENITESKKLTVAYEADLRHFAVYYILQPTTGDYTSATTATALNALLGNGYVYRYAGEAYTGSTVEAFDDSGKPLNSDLANDSTFEWRELDTAKTGAAPKVRGEGTEADPTIYLVYYKLKEYEIKFSAAGASPSSQTLTLRHNQIISLGDITAPTKDLSTFAGWYKDEALTVPMGQNELVDGKTTTYFAKFDSKKFTLIFDLNLGTGENQLDTDNVVGYDAATLASGKVFWNQSAIFDATFNFRQTTGDGRYAVTYDINNVSNNKGITAAKPSAIGYDFLGWFASSAATVARTNINKPTKATADEIVYTARWKPTEYSVRFYEQTNSYSLHSITNLSLWGKRLETEETVPAGSVLPEDPVRAGYVFTGWYTTAAAAAASDGAESIYSKSMNVDGDGNIYFSIADFAEYDVYGNAAAGYNFSRLSLYAGWQSVPITINSTINPTCGSVSYRYAEGGTINVATGATVLIGENIELDITENAGYRFNYITVGGRRQAAGVTSFTVASRDLREGDDGKVYLDIEVVFSEITYTITYHPDGGTVLDRTFTNRYTASNINATDPKNRAKLPSDLYKVGYDFAGWYFETSEGEDWERPEEAYETDADASELRGADMWLKQPFDLNNPEAVTYRNVILIAHWTPQEASVKLYNATYTQGEYSGPADNPEADYYEIDFDKDTSKDVVTGMTLNIINPSRQSYNFLGWATTRNGAVVYPASADSDVTTIEYTVNPERDQNGKELNQNNLYAVWHVKGVNYIVMSAANNGCTYGTTVVNGNSTANGVTMSAKPFQPYTESGITLNYKWYRIKEGMYDECFVTNYVYMDGDDITGYEIGGKYYKDADAKEPLTDKPAGEAFAYKDFDEAKAAQYCDTPIIRNGILATEASTLKITEVAKTGIYVCVVEVVANSDGSTSRAQGYGEIEISMSKAICDKLTLEDKTVTYNAEERWDEMVVSGLPVSLDGDGNTIVTLPDGSKVAVTYTFYQGEGELRRQITDLSAVKNAGTYFVVASFRFADTEGADKGNYELMSEIEAELVIEKDVISQLEYWFVHGDDESKTSFTGVYDGEAYGVRVDILDTFGSEVGGSAVTEKDGDLAVTYKVYKVTDEGDTELTGAAATTVTAGTYCIVVTGLSGTSSVNYELKEDITLRCEYTIGKKQHEVAGHITFGDDEVEFNNLIQTIEIEIAEGYELPESVQVSYTAVYEAAEDGFTAAKADFADNGGKNAGTYTVTVKFTDSEAANYEALPDMTATLTVKKANLLQYYKDTYDRDLLQEGGFVSNSYAYSTTASYQPHIEGGLLANTEFFSVYYYYYKVEEARGREPLFDGTYNDGSLNDIKGNKDKSLYNDGRYEVFAKISYESITYLNNFEEVTESESTITIIIEEGTVETVTVKWKDGLTAAVGSGFDYSLIEEISVKYQDNPTPRVITGDDVAIATVKFERKGGEEQTTFWHTGDFVIVISMFDTDSEEYTFSVTQKIDKYTLLYSTGSDYTKVDEKNGLEQLTDGSHYTFKIEYKAINSDGVEETMRTDATYTGELQLGNNPLTVDGGVYTFGGDGVSVGIYKVVTSADVEWQYYDEKDGGWKPLTKSLPYIGAEYRIQVVLKEDGGRAFPAVSENGNAVKDYNSDGYVMVVGRIDEYKITAEYALSIAKRAVEFDWSDGAAGAKLEYTGLHNVPVVSGTDIFDEDKAGITFTYEFFRGSNAEGSGITRVTEVGDYSVRVSLSGDASIINNYTLSTSTTAVHNFSVVKANIDMDAVYSESTYGNGISFVNNPQGLRKSAVKADFKGKEAILGEFYFITNVVGNTYDIVTDEKSLKDTYLSAEGTVEVDYVFKPNNQDSYNDKIGKFTLSVRPQVERNGENSLRVELTKAAIQVYYLNMTFDTVGINVYQLHYSSYQEKDVWYGYEYQVTEPSFRIGNTGAKGYPIDRVDVSNGYVELLARSGDNKGTLRVPVIDKKPSKIVIANEGDFRKMYYVGETPDFEDIEFYALFDDGDPLTLKMGNVKAYLDVDGDDEIPVGKLTEAGTLKVRFVYLDWFCIETFTVLEQDIVTVAPMKEPTIIPVNGATAPKLSYIINGEGDPVSSIKGLTYTSTVHKNGSSGATLTEPGEYEIIYKLTITDNPQYKLDKDTFTLQVVVTLNPYSVDLEPESDELTVTYKKEGTYAIPKPVIASITDTTDGDKLVAESNYTVTYKINGKPVTLTSGDWNVADVGEYTVEVTIRIKSPEYLLPETYGYTFKIEKAANDKANASISVPEVVVLGSTNFNFDVTADFGADKAQLLYYCPDKPNSDYSTVKPDMAGTWYVKAVIPDTKNYAGIVDLGSGTHFEVRDPSREASTNNGSISGGNGVGADWTLTITQMDSEDVGKESINKQNVLDGYVVEFVRNGGGSVTGEGEYTVRVKLGEELAGRSDLKVFFKSANKTVQKSAKVVRDGDDTYIEFKTSEFGSFIITSAQPGEPIGLLVAVIVLGVVAAGLVATCIVVFVKKRKGARK